MRNILILIKMRPSCYWLNLGMEMCAKLFSGALEGGGLVGRGDKEHEIIKTRFCSQLVLRRGKEETSLLGVVGVRVVWGERSLSQWTPRQWV